MLIDASRIAAAPSITAEDVGRPLTVSMPPTTMIPLIALVTLISGVCSAGVTFHTTCQPTMHASANTVRCDRNSAGALRPRKMNSAAASSAKIAPPTPDDCFFGRWAGNATFAATAAGFGGSGTGGRAGGGQITSPP